MKLELLYQELLDIAKRNDITIRKETGTFRGGSCVMNTHRFIVINKHQSLETTVNTIASQLARMEVKDDYIKPAVREILDSAAERYLKESV